MPNQLVSIHGSIDATTAHVPIKKLCMAKPEVRCSLGNISPTKALNGSIEILMEASIIQSIPAATQSTGEFGITNNASEAKIAPTKKKGRRRPSLFHVLSLKWPTMG